MTTMPRRFVVLRCSAASQCYGRAEARPSNALGRAEALPSRSGEAQGSTFGYRQKRALAAARPEPGCLL